MDNKYIFVPYEGRFDVNIFFKEIFEVNIFWGKKETYLQCDIRFKFMSYISLFIEILYLMKYERVEKQGFRNQ